MVAWPTVKTIVGNALAPGLVDRYLARNGYDAQQADEPVDPNRRDNLFEPVPGDHGAHGPFDERARSSSLEWTFRKHRSIAGAGGAVAAAAIGLWRKARV
jgi:hypothetical protein